MTSKEIAEHFPLPELTLRFFNTETRQKESFRPLNDKKVCMYTCGPTVYHFAHIGNFRTYVFEDILRRTLKFFGMAVHQVMNLTDVDDKTIRGAIQSNLSLADYTEPYKKAFFEDIQTLGIEKAERYPAATEFIHQMVAFIQNLVDKQIAYVSKDKSIYYSIEKCPKYGRLSHLKLSELKTWAGDARVACDEYEKEHVGDFVLWKAYDPERDGHIYWESPFGPGRPGWHLECSTMATEILGETIDIHVGAVDNIFPHHENEIAQSESLTGKQFVKYWLHSEHLIVNHKKMSKSLGNFYTLRDLLKKGYTGMEVRYMLMHIHYRTQLNFTFEGLDAAKKSLQRLNDFVLRLQESADPKAACSAECRSILKEALTTFCEALADDLNISVALASVFDMMHAVNVLAEQKKLTPKDAAETLHVMWQFNLVLGVLDFEQNAGPPPYLVDLLRQRGEARAQKNWMKADQLRQEILSAGYVIEDTPEGARLKRS